MSVFSRAATSHRRLQNSTTGSDSSLSAAVGALIVCSTHAPEASFRRFAHLERHAIAAAALSR